MPKARSVADRERDAQAVALRTRGLTHRQIAAQLGWSSPASAVEAINRALRDSYRENLEELRRVEEDKLDDLTRLAWREISRPHFVSSTATGRVVLHPVTGEPLVDSDAVLKGIDRLLRIAERRAKLRGLDKPIQHEVRTIDEIDARLLQLAEQVG
jgi:hypothetical protein